MINIRAPSKEKSGILLNNLLRCENKKQPAYK